MTKLGLEPVLIPESLLFTSNHYTDCGCFAVLPDTFHPPHRARLEHSAGAETPKACAKCRGVRWDDRIGRKDSLGSSLPPAPILLTSVKMGQRGKSRRRKQLHEARRQGTNVPFLTLTLAFKVILTLQTSGSSPCCLMCICDN